MPKQFDCINLSTKTLPPPKNMSRLASQKKSPQKMSRRRMSKSAWKKSPNNPPLKIVQQEVPPDQKTLKKVSHFSFLFSPSTLFLPDSKKGTYTCTLNRESSQPTLNLKLFLEHLNNCKCNSKQFSMQMIDELILFIYI